MLYKRWMRVVIGIILIEVSLAGLVYWESLGRDKWLSEPVLTANRFIKAGERISPKDFVSQNVREEHIAEGALISESQLSGRDLIARVDIPYRGQIVESHFEEGRYTIAEEEHLFPIKSHWIDAVSSSLRGGDMVNIYNQTGDILFGTFRVAFVKDKTYREVYDDEEGTVIKTESLERADGTGPVESLEITASLEKYLTLKNFTEAAGGKLLIVQMFEK